MELDADRGELAAPVRGRERERTRYALIEALTCPQQRCKLLGVDLTGTLADSR